MNDKTNPLHPPKFLTREMAEIAVRVAIQTIIDPPDVDQPHFGHEELKAYLQPVRKQCHIVVLVPGMSDLAEGLPDWQNYQPRPVVLYEYSNFDGADELEASFDKIAQSKAVQLWTGRNDDRTTIIPHLLFRGETPYWGGVRRRGIVVTCSGVQAHIDKLVSGIVADLLVAMAHAAWKASLDCEEEFDFLS